MKSTSHRDKARLFTEDSRSAAKFMQPSPPPHHGVDSRRAEAMRDAEAVARDREVGREQAANAARYEHVAIGAGSGKRPEGTRAVA